MMSDYEYEDHLTRAKRAISSLQEYGHKFTEGLYKAGADMIITRLVSSILPCKYCKKTPLPRDVGGNNAYYELGCKCPDGIVVGSKNLMDVINCWNIYNEVRNDEEERDTL